MRETTFLPGFVRLPMYDKSAAGVLMDDDERELEQTLIANPEAGDVVKGAGGVRKVRVGRAGRGKRGGARVIYVYRDREGIIYLLYAYAKGESDDLTPAGKAEMRRLVAEL